MFPLENQEANILQSWLGDSSHGVIDSNYIISGAV